MPGYTTHYGLPYPFNGDPIYQGAAQMQSLAEKVDQVLHDASIPPGTVTLPASCSAYRTGAQSIPNAADTWVVFQASDWNTDSMYGTTGVTVTRAGVYAVTAQIPWDGTGGGTRIQRISRVRAGVTAELQHSEISIIGGLMTATLSTQARFNVGDVIRLGVWQNQGATRTIGGHATDMGARTSLQVTLLRPM